MKLVVQRVSRASVRVEGSTCGEIGPGLLVLVGVSGSDTAGDLEYLAGKVSRLRVFDDEAGKMNLDLSSVGGSLLVVSQFTLYGDCRKGNRPSYLEAAGPEAGREGYEQFVARLREMGHRVETGEFQEHMEVELVNDGPVTLLLESEGRA